MASQSIDAGSAGISTYLQRQSTMFLVSIVLAAASWQLVATSLDLVETISSPRATGLVILELVASGDVFPPLIATLSRTAFAIAIAVVVGTAFGLVVGVGDIWKRSFEDYILAGLSFPPLLGAVIAAMWFGVSHTTAVVAGGLLAAPYLSQNVAKAVENVDRELVIMSDAFGVSNRRVLTRVVLRSILPEWFSGFRYTFAVSWKIVTVAEVVALGSGVGYMVERAMDQLSMSGVLAWTIVFAVIVLIIEYGILQQIEERVFVWREETHVGGGIA